MYSFILVFAAKELNLIEVEKCAVVDAYIIANREEILSEYCKSFNVQCELLWNN
jgi:hypothetical protein